MPNRDRCEFGDNWAKFVRKRFSREQVDIARKQLLEFLGRVSLEGLSFLDIGSSSGVHSLAASEAGARSIVSFDYDPVSVETTRTFRTHKDPPSECWLDVKRRYVAASTLRRRRMELSYLWRFRLQRKPWKLPDLTLHARRYKKSRGMNFMTDVRDWLGGWPMEFCHDADVVDLVSRECGMTPLRMKTGRANTEFLAEKPPAP